MTGNHQSDFFFFGNFRQWDSDCHAQLFEQSEKSWKREEEGDDTEGNGAFHVMLIEGHIKNHIVPPPCL